MFFFMPETKFTGYRWAILPGDHSIPSEKKAASSHIEKAGDKHVSATLEEFQDSVPKHSRIALLTVETIPHNL
jgi:hypothetical protein